MNYKDKESIVELIDDVVADFDEDKFLLAYQRAVKHAEVDDTEIIAKQFAFELSKMAWNIILTEAEHEGLVKATIDQQTGELRYWTAD